MNRNSHVLAGSMSHEAALLSGDPFKECLARFAVSDFAERMTDFINAELERGTDLATLMVAMARFHISVHASVAAQTMALPAIETTARMYQEMVGESYLVHVNRIHQQINEGELA